MRIQQTRLAFGERIITREELGETLTNGAEKSLRQATDAKNHIAAIGRVHQQNRKGLNHCAEQTCNDEVSRLLRGVGTFIQKLRGK